jgi:hypothetical protein
MSKVIRIILSFVLSAILLPSIAIAQSTDRSELDEFLKQTANQGAEPPVGTKITVANWQQYKQFLPFGMAKLFAGQYQWKMPQDVEIDIGPARYGNLPKTWIEATEKYGAQDSVEVLPNGPFQNQQLPRRRGIPESGGAAQGLQGSRQRILRSRAGHLWRRPREHVGDLVRGPLRQYLGRHFRLYLSAERLGHRRRLSG